MKHSKNHLWNIKAETQGRDDFDFYVTDNNEYAIYFPNIDEYGMLKFASPAQIWSNRENPKLLFDNPKVMFEYQYSESCYYLDKSDIIVLLTPCQRHDFSDLLYVLLDFTKRQFATINAPNFTLAEIEKGIVRFDIQFRYVYDEITKINILKENGKLIHLAELKWCNLRELNKICLSTNQE
jgi:hypothetical protein